MSKKAYLILENGTVFEGKSFGYEKEVTGEVVFTTGMAGYIETLTDPSYYGQIVTQTFPLIGNYGIISSDFESDKPYLSAYIVKEVCEHPSNFRCEKDLETFLKESEIPGLCGIDTRRLTKIVRENGVMNGKIAYEDNVSEEDIEKIKAYKIVDAVASVTCKEPEIYQAEYEKYKVVLWDFGEKKNIIRQLLKRNVSVICVPASFTAEEILKYKPDGIMLSNGPGDPAENVGVIEEIKKICESNLPIFGICLGHQLLALAQGAKTEKLKYGHRGANQPALEKETNKVFITSQNHGYAVVGESLPEYAEVTFTNANDGTCEGVSYSNMPAFSVQFHPEAAAGPLDTSFLFDRFVELIEGGVR